MSETQQPDVAGDAPQVDACGCVLSGPSEALSGINDYMFCVLAYRRFDEWAKIVDCAQVAPPLLDRANVCASTQASTQASPHTSPHASPHTSPHASPHASSNLIHSSQAYPASPMAQLLAADFLQAQAGGSGAAGNGHLASAEGLTLCARERSYLSALRATANADFATGYTHWLAALDTESSDLFAAKRAQASPHMISHFPPPTATPYASQRITASLLPI